MLTLFTRENFNSEHFTRLEKKSATFFNAEVRGFSVLRDQYDPLAGRGRYPTSSAMLLTISCPNRCGIR